MKEQPQKEEADKSVKDNQDQPNASSSEIPKESSTKQPESNPNIPTHFVFFGTCKWDLVGRKTIPKSVLKNGGSDAGEELHAPTRFLFESYRDTRFISIHSGCVASHLILIDDNGLAYGLGRNDFGQLGRSNHKSRHHLTQIPVPLKDGERITFATCGRNHSLFVTDTGRAFACGHNQTGQLGCGSKSDSQAPGVSDVVPVKIDSAEKVISCSAGSDFSIWLCESGRVFAAGHGQYGQLGNGRTGEHIHSAGRVAYDTVSTPVQVIGFGTEKEEVKVTQVASGANHTLALDVDGKVWSWGWGGYGRLGHRTPNDELRPRKVEALEGEHYKLDFIACGQTASFAVQRNRKSCYSWGITKKTGEANTYPKPLYDLQGWVIKTLACGATSTVLAAEQSIISWGGSPTFGELGYGKGKPKSSTKPQQVKSLEGLEIDQLCEGQAFTAMLVKANNKEQQAIIDKLDQREIANDFKSENEKRKAPDSTNRKKKGKGKSKKQRR